jgi:hypothetical protein
MTEDRLFDLLLLDVHMPELDGFQFAQAIRKREQTTGSHLPVIALTACSRKDDRERCLAVAMDDYLSKPVQAADLWAAIHRVAVARPRTARPEVGLLDPRVVLAACGGDAGILTEHLPGALDEAAGSSRSGSRGPALEGHAPPSRSRAQAVWNGGGPFHRGRVRGVRPRRSRGSRPTRRGSASGRTA